MYRAVFMSVEDGLKLAGITRTLPRLGGLNHLNRFTYQNTTSADRVTRPGRPGNPPSRVTLPIMKTSSSKMRDYMERRVTPPAWGPPLPCKQTLLTVI